MVMVVWELCDSRKPSVGLGMPSWEGFEEASNGITYIPPGLFVGISRLEISR
jgi:hypothetical protein